MNKKDFDSIVRLMYKATDCEYYDIAGSLREAKKALAKKLNEKYTAELLTKVAKNANNNSKK